MNDNLSPADFELEEGVPPEPDQFTNSEKDLVNTFLDNCEEIDSDSSLKPEEKQEQKGKILYQIAKSDEELSSKLIESARAMNTEPTTDGMKVYHELRAKELAKSERRAGKKDREIETELEAWEPSDFKSFRDQIKREAVLNNQTPWDIVTNDPEKWRYINLNSENFKWFSKVKNQKGPELRE